MAAKTDVGLERSNNEDNFQASANLAEGMTWVNDQQYSLGNKGALLVVADGMGGMNAGEVASEIAIDTVRECFAPEKITDEVVKNRYTIEKFMKGVIVEADKRIKEFAKSHPESRGMGTTIVIAWLFDGSLYVSWCGDSRAYLYNPASGLVQISKDHSYVQELVDAGRISSEDAFDFPDSNIITRSLSDSTPKASPDCLLMPLRLCNNDIVLLCSDGLNGMLRDAEIEKILVSSQSNMTECVDTLIQGALDAAGADNCTVALCQILSGGEQATGERFANRKQAFPGTVVTDGGGRRNRLWLISLLIVLCLCVAGAACYYLWPGITNIAKGGMAEQSDSTIVQTGTTTEKTDSTTVQSDSMSEQKQEDGQTVLLSTGKEKPSGTAATVQPKGDVPLEDNDELNPVGFTHIVKDGDTLEGIAKQYGVTVEQIRHWNRLKESDVLKIGQEIKISKKS